MPTHILGFNCFAHDAAASIIRDGEHLGLVEEERFLRRKHVGDFPRHSIQWCCDVAGIKPSELDHLVFYWDPKLARWARLGHVLRYFPRSLELIRSRLGKETPMRQLKQTLRDELGIDFSRTKLWFAAHHICHAASSFLTSPFDKAAILTLDAAGEWDCTWLGAGDGLDMTPLRAMSFPNSVGLVYGAVTEFLGYKFASGEGKVMGLAPYGDPNRYLKQFQDILKIKPDGHYEVDLSYFAYHYRGRPNWFTQKFYDVFGRPYAAEESRDPDQRARDISAALQKQTEEVGLHLARWLRQKTGLNKVCLAGGVCLNSVMNGRILLEGVFDEVVVQPAANDAGTALGACYWLWNTVMRQPRSYVFEHAYFGPWFEDADYVSAIEKTVQPQHPVEYRKVADVSALAARMLADGKIVGWFQDRMEMGPRALGNRTILCDPRSNQAKDLLNSRVKFREAFRPFAPSVLEEKTGEWFATGYPSPYMILVYDVLPDKRSLVPAITHVDGTGRVQSVSKKHNPRYHRLIQEFEKITGVPMVLNTSFNIRGEPIVLRPEQAIECFLKTGMDALFLGDYVLTKKTVSAARDLTDEQLEAAHASAMAADNAVP
jgi:carbamoyltransferase